MLRVVREAGQERISPSLEMGINGGENGGESNRRVGVSESDEPFKSTVVCTSDVGKVLGQLGFFEAGYDVLGAFSDVSKVFLELANIRDLAD